MSSRVSPGEKRIRILGIRYLPTSRPTDRLQYDEEAMQRAMKDFAQRQGPVMRHGVQVGHMSFVGFDEDGRPVMNIHVDPAAIEQGQAAEGLAT